jgi:hypothetical protein
MKGNLGIRNEKYCREKFGEPATQVIMDAIDSSIMQR